MQMVSLKLDPDGKNIFSSTLIPASNQTSVNVMETESKLQEMTMRVKELESELKELKELKSYQVTSYTCMYSFKSGKLNV